MDVSNNTGADTGVRTGSGTPPKIYEKESLILIAPGEVVKIPDPPCCPFTVDFLVDGQVVLTATCDEPLRRITLMRPGRSGKYQVRRFKKPPQPPRRRTLPAGDGPRASTRA